jgi:hypothetical protein
MPEFLYIFFFIGLFILELLRCGFARQDDEAREISVLKALSGDNIAYSGKELILFSGLSRERGRLTPFPIGDFYSCDEI